ncbi:hypothetical protein Ae706Ps2_4819 [Pseudonocardia sp. Ae706_Ps2]|nr:hypothetical protein Ae505Ps2_0480c [Pseudonocardia sp. Ae505_Ps2]OLM26386.1 hypothetical protein Ae706Ps2_4819 [Pseudonocardia sp. Ae706_Ps2]
MRPGDHACPGFVRIDTPGVPDRLPRPGFGVVPDETGYGLRHAR